MKHEKTVEGIGHVIGDWETSHVRMGGELHSLSSLLHAAGTEVLRESEESGFMFRGLDWADDRAEYHKRTQRGLPRVYRLKITVEAETLSEEEGEAYWAAVAARESVPEADADPRPGDAGPAGGDAP
jgi:hypothetical protein